MFKKLANVSWIINTMCWQEYGDIGTLVYCWRKCRMIQLFLRAPLCYVALSLVCIYSYYLVILFAVIHPKAFLTQVHKGHIYSAICSMVAESWKQSESLWLEEWVLKWGRGPACSVMWQWASLLDDAHAC